MNVKNGYVETFTLLFILSTKARVNGNYGECYGFAMEYMKLSQLSQKSCQTYT